MRRWSLAAASLVIVVLAAALLWPRAPSPGEPEPSPLAASQFVPVDVLAAPSQQSYALTGIVRDPTGQPVPNAEVSLAASSQVSLVDVRCGLCRELLISCHAHESARSVSSLLDRGQGLLTAALTVKSDAEGRFRFEALSGISFTVWGEAPGFGVGVKERAAPGDPVELYLPLPRTLTGTLRDEFSRPIAGLVRVTSRRLAKSVEVNVDATGAFSVTGLGEGPFAVVGSAKGLLPALEAEAEAGGRPVQLTLRTPRRLEIAVVREGKPADAVVTLQGDHVLRQLEAKGGAVAIDALYPGELFATAVSGTSASVPTRVTLAAATTRVTLTLDKGGTVAVTVNDEAGQPVPKPTLELLTRGHELIARKELQEGELAVLGPVGAGEYQLRARAPGYQSVSAPVQVKAGETSIELTLTRGTTIRGRVVDEYGRPAGGVSVLVTPMGDSVLADAQGHFLATVPSPGLYELHAHHSDWGGVDKKVQAPNEDVELQLEPRAGVQVTVTAEGRRLEGASVTLFHARGNFRNDRPSGADGVVLMRGLPPDAYTLVATHPDWLGSERQPITLRDGELQKVNVELKAGGSIVGTVVDTTGVPVAGITVSTAPRASEPQTTDGEGRFKLGPVRPNVTYSLRATLRGYEQLDRTTSRAGGEPVRVVVKRLSVYRGRVLSEGQPLKNFRVDEHEVTSADGTFELPLPSTSDKVIVAIEAPGHEPLMSDRPNAPDLGDFELKRAPQVTGVVRDDGGQPVPDAVVSCEACEQSVMTDAQGRFVIGKPAFQREFTLIARKGRRSATRTVSGNALQGLELTLRPGVKLSGVAWLQGGVPASGLEIAGINVERNETMSVVTNEDGSYATEISPGIYRFMPVVMPALSGSEDPPALIVEVRADTRLDFGPVPGLGTLSVRVTPRPGFALWLVKGDVARVGNPPMELLRSSWAQLVYQPHGDRVLLGGLSPGRYTLVWASFHAAIEGGPLIVPVQVPASGEVTLVR